MDVVAGLERTLQGQIKPMITQCTIRHLYLLPTVTPSTESSIQTSTLVPTTTAVKNALVDLARSFERRRCNHHTLDDPLSTLECFSSVVDPKNSGTNKNRYVVASQEEPVRRWARGIKGVPSVYVKRSVMVMEPMSEGSTGVREGVERGKLRGGIRKSGEQGTGKRKRGGEDEEAKTEATRVQKKKRIRGPKQPNPLSVKKAKKTAVSKDVGKEITHGERDEDITMDEPERTLVLRDSDDESVYKKKRKRKHKSGNVAVVDNAPMEVSL
ncbi:hypothetical protein MMC13_006212 [Lambiella insularis]|nr:hypothetical protein [Lambiella insularis]